MNHDYAHCMDYDSSCPMSCFRARLTADAQQRGDLIGVPLTWSNFRGTSECGREHPEGVVWSCTIKGEPRTKKNSQIIAGSGRKCPECKKPEKQWIKQSDQHDAWAEAAAWQLQNKPREPIDFPVGCKYICYMATRRRVDGLNLYAAIDDLLVKNHILADDNSTIVIHHDGSRVYYDKDNPRVEIEITKENL